MRLHAPKKKDRKRPESLRIRLKDDIIKEIRHSKELRRDIMEVLDITERTLSTKLKNGHPDLTNLNVIKLLANSLGLRIHEVITHEP